MTNDEIQARGERAKALLLSEALTETVTTLELRYYNDWSRGDSTKQREELFGKVVALRDLIAELTGWVSASEQIAHQLEQAEFLKEENFNDD